MVAREGGGQLGKGRERECRMRSRKMEIQFDRIG